LADRARDELAGDALVVHFDVDVVNVLGGAAALR